MSCKPHNVPVEKTTIKNSTDNKADCPEFVPVPMLADSPSSRELLEDKDENLCDIEDVYDDFMGFVRRNNLPFAPPPVVDKPVLEPSMSYEDWLESMCQASHGVDAAIPWPQEESLLEPLREFRWKTYVLRPSSCVYVCAGKPREFADSMFALERRKVVGQTQYEVDEAIAYTHFIFRCSPKVGYDGMINWSANTAEFPPGRLFFRALARNSGYPVNLIREVYDEFIVEFQFDSTLGYPGEGPGELCPKLENCEQKSHYHRVFKDRKDVKQPVATGAARRVKEKNLRVEKCELKMSIICKSHFHPSSAYFERLANEDSCGKERAPKENFQQKIDREEFDRLAGFEDAKIEGANDASPGVAAEVDEAGVLRLSSAPRVCSFSKVKPIFEPATLPPHLRTGHRTMVLGKVITAPPDHVTPPVVRPAKIVFHGGEPFCYRPEPAVDNIADKKKTEEITYRSLWAATMQCPAGGL